MRRCCRTLRPILAGLLLARISTIVGTFILVGIFILIRLTGRLIRQRRRAGPDDRRDGAGATVFMGALVYRYRVKLILPVHVVLVLAAQPQRVELRTFVLPTAWLQAVVSQHGRIVPGHVVVAIVGP